MLAAVGVVGGLLTGLIVGGRLDSLLAVRLKWLPVILIGIAIRFATESAIASDHLASDLVRAILLASGYALITIGLLRNREFPGMTAAAVGVAANGIAIALNAGRMPVWEPSLGAAGFSAATFSSPFHTLLPAELNNQFLIRAGILGDIVPIPLPLLQSVASAGDLLLAAGLGFVVFGAIVRAQPFAAGLTPTAGVGVQVRGITEHPYARLAANGPFSALWLGQAVSCLGDRIHQIALVFLVANATGGSPLAVSLAFAAAMVPNVLVGPIAGAYVDRWDYRRVMVASDLLRALIVFSIPFAASIDIALIYPLVFVIAAVSAFFRPARSASIPRIVSDRDLMAANSAIWMADNAADVAGYPLAGLFVAFLGSSLSLAFWVDSISYLGSAALIAAVAIPRVPQLPARGRSIRHDVVDGWKVLRTEAALFGTTVQAVVAEFGAGTLIALAPLLIASLPAIVPAPTGYGYFETAGGIGALVGGIAVGAAGTRLSGGRAISAGFGLYGLVLMLLAASHVLPVTLALGFTAGIANVAFIVPSQTLFQERTPAEFLGRVIAIRLALVNASLAIAMVASGSLAEVLGVPVVIGVCGVLTLVAGISGLFVKAIREA